MSGINISRPTGKLDIDNSLAAYIPGEPVFTVPVGPVGVLAGIPSAAVVSVQLKNVKGINAAVSYLCRLWISNTAGGIVPITANLPSAAETDIIGTQFQTLTAKGHWLWVSNSDGVIGFTINNQTAPKTFYVNIELCGRIYSSGAIEFVPDEPEP